MIGEQNYSVTIGDGADIPLRDWKCYTDGSKTGSGSKAGSGGLILRRGLIVKTISFSVGTAKVFQAELCAITACADTLTAHNISQAKIDFMIDSQASLLALSNPRTSSDTVRTAKKALNKLGASNELRLHYIEAHKSWQFNELADKQAKWGQTWRVIPQMFRHQAGVAYTMLSNR